MTSESNPVTRRTVLGALTGAAALGGLAGSAPADPVYKLAVFEADVTPPIGHPLMGGGIEPAKEIVDRLQIRGLVISTDEAPIVIAAIDWCEIRNDAHAAWRSALAEAVGTQPSRVLFSSIHQHDAPIADLEAERLLEKAGAKGRICDLAFHEKAVREAARAAGAAAKTLRPISHVGVGLAKVEKVASNRRYVDASGQPRHDRTSATKDPAIRDQPEGTIDPNLRALSFWDGDAPVAVLYAYATHPMSRYGRGAVSDDFVGLARRRRAKADPSVFPIYISGCSGNVTAGKYNDGSPENREILAGRIERAMEAAWKATKRRPLGRIGLRVAKLRLDLRGGEGREIQDLDERLSKGPRPFDQCLAALGLSRAIALRDGAAIDVPCVDFGPAQYLLLPGESYVEYQLAAQSLREDKFVMVAGYGECSTGYVPTDRAFAENDSNLHDWCWVAPGSEPRMIAAIREALGL